MPSPASAWWSAPLAGPRAPSRARVPARGGGPATAGDHPGGRTRRGVIAATGPSPGDASAADDEATVRLAVVGAHLEGMPLHHQLAERGAVLDRACATSAHYRLHVLPGRRLRRPGLLRVPSAGRAIQVEVWRIPLRAFGSLVCAVPAPLVIGTIELDDGSAVKGFLCEHYALIDSEDITRFGGWRRYLAQR